MKTLKVHPRNLDRVLSAEELDLLLRQIAHENPFAGDVCAFLAYVGCRLGGAQPLKWDNVDRDLKWVRLREKGDNEYVAPLNSKAAALLRRLHDAQTKDGVAPGGRVFHGATNRVKQIRNALKRSAALLDSPVKTPHYFRHWFISQAVMQGVPAKIVAAWGWS